jgi:uncharacterized OsmC-like protein
MVLTVAAVADAKGIELEQLSTRVEMRVEQAPGRPARTRFASDLVLDGRLTQRERTILFNSARRCEVHRLLQGEVEFEERLAEP